MIRDYRGVQDFLLNILSMINFGLFLVSSRILPIYSAIILIDNSCAPPKKRTNTMIVVIPLGALGLTK